MTRPQRRARRRWHITFGVTAVALAVVHAAGRFVQVGVSLRQPVADLLVVCVLILGVSGILRALTPGRHAAALTAFAWLHRLGAVGMLTLVFTHATQMTLGHLARLAAAAAAKNS